MARGRPAKPRPDGSNLTAETFLSIYDEAFDAKADLDSARGKYQNIFKRAEGLGINRAALSRALKEASRDRDKREIDDRDYAKYMAFLGKPVGYQSAMDLGAGAANGVDPGDEAGDPPDPSDEAAMKEHRLKSAEREGYDAGKIGADLGRSNPFQPGTEENQRFSTGWKAGQSEAVGAMGSAPRGGGRSRKDASGAPIPAPRDEFARGAGKADGVAGHRDHAARFGPGEPSHADYEAGHREGEMERHPDNSQEHPAKTVFVEQPAAE